MRRRDDDDEVVRDGSSVRVPLMLCDGEVMMLPPWQRDVMLSLRYQMSDAEAARHRPGFRFADAAANRAKAKAYDDSVVEASNAWLGHKNPALLRHRARCAERGQAVKDEAYRRMVEDLNNAWRQPAREVVPPVGEKSCNAGLLPRADAAPPAPPRFMDAATAQAIRDKAYQEYCADLCNAWRGPQP